MAVVLGPGAACGAPPDGDVPKTETVPAATTAERKAMKMDEPMAGGMKKDGTMKGDVRKAADKKQRDMKEAMDKEEKAMGGEKPR